MRHVLPSRSFKQQVTTYVGCLVIVVSSTVATAQSQRETLSRAVIEPQPGRHLPLNETFFDHTGMSLTIGEVVRGDRPTVLCLVYFECPMLCRLAADGLIRSVAALEEDVGDSFNVVIVSFDPRDTPERATAARFQALRLYAREASERGWFFLTGKQQAIDALTDAVGFRYVWDQETQQFSHAAGLIIVSGDGVITEYLDGVRFTPTELHEAIQRAHSGIVTDAESISFARCYLYDPTTGRFGIAVQWAIRVLGLITVVTIIVGLRRMNGIVIRRRSTGESG